MSTIERPDHAFADVADRFAAWIAQQQPRPIERAWKRAGFRILYAPVSRYDFAWLPADEEATPPIALLPERVRDDPPMRALMLRQLAACLESFEGCTPWIECLRRAQAIEDDA